MQYLSNCKGFYQKIYQFYAVNFLVQQLVGLSEEVCKTTRNKKLAGQFLLNRPLYKNPQSLSQARPSPTYRSAVFKIYY